MFPTQPTATTAETRTGAPATKQGRETSKYEPRTRGNLPKVGLLGGLAGGGGLVALGEDGLKAGTNDGTRGVDSAAVAAAGLHLKITLLVCDTVGDSPRDFARVALLQEESAALAGAEHERLRGNSRTRTAVAVTAAAAAGQTRDHKTPRKERASGSDRVRNMTCAPARTQQTTHHPPPLLANWRTTNSTLQSMRQ
jgi:hypothetical protein